MTSSIRTQNFEQFRVTLAFGGRLTPSIGKEDGGRFKRGINGKKGST